MSREADSLQVVDEFKCVVVHRGLAPHAKEGACMGLELSPEWELHL